MNNTYTLKKKISMGTLSIPKGTVFSAELTDGMIKVKCQFGIGIFNFDEFREYFEVSRKKQMTTVEVLEHLSCIIEDNEECTEEEREALEIAIKFIGDYLQVESSEEYDY